MHNALKIILTLFCVYRVVAVIIIDLPMGLGCKITDCLKTPIPLRQGSYCMKQCPFFQQMKDYIKVDPVIGSENARAQILMLGYTFIITPLLVIITIATNLNFQWVRTAGLMLGSVMVFTIGSLFVEYLMESPNPALVISYNLLDFIGPIYMLVIFFFEGLLEK